MSASKRKSAQRPGQTFEDFFTQHYKTVYRAAYCVTHNRQDAEDVVQNVFVKVMQRPDSLELAQNPIGYLCRAAMHEALNSIRGRTRAEAAVGRMEPPNGPSAIEDNAHDRLDAAMAKLTPEQVKMLVLRYEYGYRAGEIARELGCSEIKVRATLCRTRFQLGELMDAMDSDRGSQRSREGLDDQLSAGGQS